MSKKKEKNNMENKTEFVPFSCTAEEFDVIRKNPDFASYANLSLSEFIIKQNEWRREIFRLIDKTRSQKVQIDNQLREIVRIISEKNPVEAEKISKGIYPQLSKLLKEVKKDSDHFEDIIEFFPE